tara:strand:- start:4776 stop:5666 length:891 start_codon:yes stop_codon:yes gene_type:complete
MKNILYFIITLFLFNFGLSLSIQIIPKSSFYKDHYLASIEDALVNLKKTSNERRGILLGGSSLGWGVSAEQLSTKFKLQYINTGVHAAIGYKNIWNIYEKSLNKDKDIIIISPEYGSISSTNISPEVCTLTYLNIFTKIICVPTILDHHIRNLFFSNVSNNEYNRNGFNSFGDHIAHLDKKKKNFIPKNICNNLPTKYEQNKYINFYLSKIQEGYKIIYVPAVIPNSSCKKDLIYLRELVKNLDTKINGNNFHVNAKLTLDESYFYDTEYHMVKEGIDIKTELFAESISTIVNKYD